MPSGQAVDPFSPEPCVYATWLPAPSLSRTSFVIQLQLPLLLGSVYYRAGIHTLLRFGGLASGSCPQMKNSSFESAASHSLTLGCSSLALSLPSRDFNLVIILTSFSNSPDQEVFPNFDWRKGECVYKIL